MICYLQSAQLGKPVVQFSVSLKAQAQESGRWISQLRESTQTLPLLFLLFWPCIDWICTHIGEVHLLYSVHQLKGQSLLETQP